MSDTKITVKTEQRCEPSLRKLARALISLARKQLEADEAMRSSDAADTKVVKPNTGDAA